MIYSEFQGEKLPLLGFGTMRLPTTADGTIDEVLVGQMVEYAMGHGVNYFDSAYPYHSGEAERVIGRALKRYPRESFLLATKFPGHQISNDFHPEEIFEEQLEKCGVEYFDYYLLHNVYEFSIKNYINPRWGMIDYFLEQKRCGRIRHLGFSSHAGLETLEAFLQQCGGDMEFCQIQLNYLDWTLQEAERKCALLEKYHLPIWVMEPVRGGKLAHLSEENERILHMLRPDESTAAWGFRFVQSIPGVKMILSGMSNMEQMRDNVRTFSVYRALTATEREALFSIAEGLKDSIPCTTCRYCCDGCPGGLNIPLLISALNSMRFLPETNVAMRVEALGEDKQPSCCIGCGKCAQICPQKIDIPQAMRELSGIMEKLPTWAQRCRERDEAKRAAVATKTD